MKWVEPASTQRYSVAVARLAFVVTMAALNGCVIPVPSETLNAIPEQSVANIRPGTSTRTDVLLSLGDPGHRGEQDSYFIYEWEKLHGGVVIGFPLPFAGGFNESCHRVAIRFASSGVVVDLKQFDGDAKVIGFPNTGDNLSVCQRDTELAKTTADWLSKPLSVVQ